MDIQENLIAHFSAATSAPFLFVGSGFSKRYLGLEDWKGLLAQFANGLKPFEYYSATADGNLPRLASLLAQEFHNHWWSSDHYQSSRDKNKSKAKDTTSALRIEICNHLNSVFLKGTLPEYKDEIDLLAQINVDGIITTNWDTLLESLFPDYRVFIGQNELLFSNPQSIGEIYKIHGSATRPASLVLTEEDYLGFEKANPYLAAKLITLFVEHPIVFLGYSLTDQNISSLLKAITHVLGPDKLDKLQNNLIFVQRAKGEEPQYSKTYMTIEGGQLPITIVTSDSFVPIYQALDVVKRKIPARILRYCKEQLYEMVRDTDPGEKFHVVDIDEIDKKDDIEFVIGVGVATERAGQIGYQGVTATNLFEELLGTHKSFDSKSIIEKSLPALGKSATYLPIFKHLKSLGIDSYEAYKKTGLELDKHLPLNGAEHYRTQAYARQFVRSEKDKTTAELISSNPPEKAAMLLPFLPRDRFDLPLVESFLRTHIERFSSSFSYSTFFRKLACLFDFYSNGWEVKK